MRRAAVVREAWRNVLGGTARAGLLALVLAVVVVGLQLADLRTVRGITAQVDAFRAAGADVLVLSATGQVDGERCALLASQPNVVAAGALRKDVDQFAATLPSSSIPSFAVTPGFPGVLLPDGGPVATGVVLSRDLADALGLGPGDRLGLLGGDSTVAAVYDYPQDGRTAGYGYALLAPTTERAPFDACWVREWPRTPETEALLRGVRVAGTPDQDAPAPELTQLNSSLGQELDAAELFAGRATRWFPLVAFGLAMALAAGATRLRRLEIASARHLGVTATDQVLVLLCETVLWAGPVLLAGAVSAAVVVAGGHPDDVLPMLALGALAPVAGVLGAAAGVGAAALTIRESDLLRFFKER